MAYLRNSWYVAAWDHEVQRLHLMRRILLGQPVLLYRLTDGTPVALEDRCCHRHAPLSQGRLLGDHVECAYHGLRFAADGKCVLVPSQEKIPKEARVRSYPVVEKHHWIWIWMGDPGAADQALIPDFSPMGGDGWNWRGETLAVAGNYLLAVENLMDLSHLPALHLTSLASTAIPANQIPVTYRTEGDAVHVEHWILDTPPPPYFRLLGGFAKDELLDRWMKITFDPPCFIRIDIGAAKAGTGAREGHGRHGVTTWNLTAVTPETEGSCHYFWAQAQDCAAGDPSLSEVDFRLVHDVLQEDLAIIRGQQENIDLDPHAPRLNLLADRPGIEAVHIVRRLIAAEQAGGREAPPGA